MPLSPTSVIVSIHLKLSKDIEQRHHVALMHCKRLLTGMQALAIPTRQPRRAQRKHGTDHGCFGGTRVRWLCCQEQKPHKFNRKRPMHQSWTNGLNDSCLTVNGAKCIQLLPSKLYRITAGW